MSSNCEICKHLDNPSSTILTTHHWAVALAPDQGYLGRCYVTLREHKGKLSALSAEEWAEFGTIATRLEGACQKAFDAAPFNWACMMNNAYRAKPPLPHVHWHFRPRYEKPVELNGLTFTDPQFGSHYDRNQRRPVDPTTYQAILGKIQANL